MKTSRLVAIFITSAFAFSGLQAMNCDENGNCYTDPVGYITLKINGADAPGQKKITLAGLGLFNPVEFQGALSGKSGKTLTISGASFEADTFAPYDNNPQKPKYFVEFIDGDYAGLMADIESHTEDSITLTVDLGSLVLGDETIRIRKHHTLASVFGSDNSAGFKAGSTASGADTIAILDSVNQDSNSYFYSSLYDRWAPITNITGDADDQVIYPEQGFIVTRFETEPLELKLVGNVKTDQTLLPVDLGKNLLANVLPVDTPLSESGLYSGDSASGVTAGATGAQADVVTIVDSNGDSNGYFYSSLYNRWAPITNIAGDADDVMIEAGSAIMISRKSGSFTWARTLAAE